MRTVLTAGLVLLALLAGSPAGAADDPGPGAPGPAAGVRQRQECVPSVTESAAATAVATAVGAGLLAALHHGPVVRLLTAAALALGVLVAVRAARSTLSPVGRRTLDVLELVLTAAAIPAALAAMGLFALVRGL